MKRTPRSRAGQLAAASTLEIVAALLAGYSFAATTRSALDADSMFVRVLAALLFLLCCIGGAAALASPKNFARLRTPLVCSMFAIGAMELCFRVVDSLANGETGVWSYVAVYAINPGLTLHAMAVLIVAGWRTWPWALTAVALSAIAMVLPI